MPIEKIPRHRIRIQQRQLDHFLEFIMRPYYNQDVAYGTCTIKLENGEEFVIPTFAEILDKIAGALAHFVHNGVQMI